MVELGGKASMGHLVNLGVDLFDRFAGLGTTRGHNILCIVYAHRIYYEKSVRRRNSSGI